MKFDELKSLKNIEIAFNTTTQQEQVIAEDSEGNCYGFDSWEEVYLKDEVDAAIAELKAKLVEQDAENRRLKRALWLARAARARSMKTCEELDNYTRNHLNRNSRWNYISSQRYDCWFYAWDNCEQKCLKKAKEYK